MKLFAQGHVDIGCWGRSVGSNVDRRASYERGAGLLSFADNNHLHSDLCNVIYPAMRRRDLWGNQQARAKNKSITGNVMPPSHNGVLIYCILSLRLLLILFIQPVVYPEWKQTLKQKTLCLLGEGKAKRVHEIHQIKRDILIRAWRIWNLLSCVNMWHSFQLVYVNYIPDNRVTYTLTGGEASYQLESTLRLNISSDKTSFFLFLFVSAFKSGLMQRCDWKKGFL